MLHGGEIVQQFDSVAFSFTCVITICASCCTGRLDVYVALYVDFVVHLQSSCCCSLQHSAINIHDKIRHVYEVYCSKYISDNLNGFGASLCKF